MNKIALMLMVLTCSVGLIYAQSRQSNIIINYTVPEVLSININEAFRDIDLKPGSTSGSIYDPREVNASYTINVNSQRPKKLIAQIDRNMPNNLVLELRAEAPSVGNSAGFVTLTTFPQTLVENINHVGSERRLLNFRLRASSGAEATTSPQTRVVTLTISD